MFPSTVARMWLDSVLAPDTRSDFRTGTETQAQARDFTRLAAWIAQRNDRYYLGTSAAQVTAAVTTLRKAYDAAPRTCARPSTGHAIARLAVTQSLQWPLAAQALAELQNPAGPGAPPRRPAVLRHQPRHRTAWHAPAGQCDSQPGHQLQRRHRPARPRFRLGRPPAAPRPLPGRRRQRDQLAASGPVRRMVLLRTSTAAAPGRRLTGTVRTPLRGRHSYLWAQQMHAAIGGTLFTVNDDVHSSTLRIPQCASHMIAYFNTGRPDSGQCPGEPVPQTSASTGQLATTPS